MYSAIYTSQFTRDIKRSKKRGKDLDKFKVVAISLLAGQSLNQSYKDHQLAGSYADRRECHIEPDWLLIYKQDENQIIFERMGSHSDLFRK